MSTASHLAGLMLLSAIVLGVYETYWGGQHCFVSQQLLRVKTWFFSSPQYMNIDSEALLSSCKFNPIAADKLKKHEHLGLLGHVFDVSGNPDMYGPEGSYAQLTGVDASRAFVSGDMSDHGLTDNLDGVATEQLGELHGWLEFYVGKYPCIGYLPGRFYDIMGQPTPHLIAIRRAWQQLKQQRVTAYGHFPDCSSLADGEKVTLWCQQTTSTSPLLLPRRFREPGKAEPRCACVHADLLSDPRVSDYPGCAANSLNCVVPADELSHGGGQTPTASNNPTL